MFILFELEGMSGEEIARAVGCPIKTVWSRLIHARKDFDVALKRLRANDPSSVADGVATARPNRGSQGSEDHRGSR